VLTLKGTTNGVPWSDFSAPALALAAGLLLSVGCAEGPLPQSVPGTETARAAEVGPVPSTRRESNRTADWPQFRGPHGLALGKSSGLPSEWNAERNVLWKTELPGAGTSSPVVFGDRIYLTAHTGYGVSPDDPGNMADLKRLLLCLNRDDGKLRWQEEVAAVLPETEYGGRMHWHGFASSTPAVDADGVYCFFGKSGVVAFDHDGNRLWQTSVGTKTHGWGSAASPVLADELVVVNAYVESGDLVALDKRTGQVRWRAGGLKESWNTPLLVELPNGRKELVVAGWGKILGFDPTTGRELWSCRSMDWYIVGSMVAHEGVVYCLAGKGVEATMAVRAGGRGDVTGTHVLWRAGKGSNVSSPVFHAGHLYFAHESQGIAYCLEAATGEVRYEHRLPRVGEIYASPIVADGKLFYVSRQRGTVVLPARPEFSVQAHNQLEGDDSVFNASPAVSGRHLLLRSDRFLYCIGAE
jgi:outer membrane protein assembly factor BamB